MMAMYVPAECPSTLTTSLGPFTAQYRRTRLLGRGDAKGVYELRDAASGTAAAAKVIPKSLLQQPRQLQRLQTELNVYHLLKHQHMVHFISSFQDEKNVYILMEPCTGVTISDIVKYHGPLDEQQAAQVLVQVLGALQYMHQQGVAHGSLQLEHLLVDNSNGIKLCSFGAATISSSSTSQKQQGTADAAAGHVNLQSGIAADTRALGMMVYTMLKGHDSAADTAAVTSSGCMVSKEQSRLSHEAQDFMQCVLSPDTAQRPSLEDLQQHTYLQQHAGSSDRWLDGINLQLIASRKATDMGSIQQHPSAAAGALPPTQLQTSLSGTSSTAAAGLGLVSAYWQVPASSMAASPDGSSSSSATPVGIFAAGDIDSSEQYFTTVDTAQRHSKAQGAAALTDQHIDLEPAAGSVGAAAAAGQSSANWRPHSLQGHAHFQQKSLQRQQAAAGGQKSLEETQADAIQRLMSEAQHMQTRQVVAPQHSSSQADVHQRLQSRGPCDPASLTSPTELPGSFSNWKGILGPARATSISQSVSAQGRGGSGLKAAEGSPITFLPLGSSSNRSSSAGSAHSNSTRVTAAGTVAFSAGLSPAVTPVDSPVGQLSVRTKTAVAVAAGAAGGSSSASKAPVPPQSPKPRGHLQAVASSSVKPPSPALPRHVHSAAPSPRTGMLLRQLSSVTGSSGIHSPGVSPPSSHGPSRQATPRSGLQQPSPAASSTSSGPDMGAFRPAAGEPQQQQQAQAGARSVESIMRSRPVYRDISPKLEQCQEQSSRSGSWQLSGQYAGLGATVAQQQQQQQQHLVPSDNSKDAAAVGVVSGSLVPSFAAVRSALGDGDKGPARPQAPGGMSPAPPLVPPSPAQQHAAELRSSIPRRASSSNIVSPSLGSQLMDSGWVPNTVQRSSTGHQQLAEGASRASSSSYGLAVAAPMDDYRAASSWLDPVSPAARSLMHPQQEGLCVLPFFRSADVSRGEPATDFKDFSLGLDSSVPSAPLHRPRVGMQAASAAGGSLPRPQSSDRLSSQGIDNIMALLNSAPSNIVPIVGRQQQHAAAKPPLHHAHQLQQSEHSGSMNAIFRNITSSTHSSQQQQQQQQQALQSGRLRKTQSMDPGQQQQPHPIPPKQTAPIARSPSVAMRTMMPSPATTPSRLLLPLHGVCSPVAERDPGSSSSTSDAHRISRLGTSGSYCSTSTSTAGGTPAVTPPSSGGMPLMPMGEPSSSGGRVGLTHGRLPLPAFHNFVHFSNSNRPATGAGWMTAADAAHGGDEGDSPGMQHQSMPSLLAPQAHGPSPSRSISSASYLQQRPGLQVAPHPPSSHHPGLLMSPKAGMVLASVPCPPQGSHPAPSPSVRACVAHGQHQAASAASSCSSSSSGVHRMMMSQVDTPTASAAYRSKNAAAAADAADAGDESPQHQQSPPVLQLAPGGRRRNSAPAAAVSVASILPSTAAAAADSVAADGRYAVLSFVDSDLFDSDQVCSGQVLAPPPLSLPGIAEQDPGSACNTPNVDWDDQREPQQQQDVQHGAQPSWQLSAGAGLISSSSHLVPYPGVSGPTSNSTGISATVPAAAAPIQAAAASRDQTVALNHSAAVTGCPGWPAPVVTAFAHYKGRLGYLMSSGVVGVIFEDSTHMITRSGGNWACYHTGAKVPPAAEPVASFSHSSSQQLHGCLDTGRSNPTLYKDQDTAGAASSSKDTALRVAVQLDTSGLDLGPGGLLFKLPESEIPPPGDSSNSRVDQDSSSRSNPEQGVPDHLAAKARCLRRFVGCLVHHKPYSSHCQPDITRLPFPAASVPQQQLGEQQQGHLHVGVLHLRRFVYREGCLLLKLTDGSHQLVFTSDNSILLLDRPCKLLASVTCSKVRRGSRMSDTAVGQQAAAGVEAVAASRSCVMPVDPAAVPPADGKLLAKVVYACKLIKALQLPPSWLQAHTAAAGSRA